MRTKLIKLTCKSSKWRKVMSYLRSLCRMQIKIQKKFQRILRKKLLIRRHLKSSRINRMKISVICTTVWCWKPGGPNQKPPLTCTLLKNIWKACPNSETKILPKWAKINMTSLLSRNGLSYLKKKDQIVRCAQKLNRFQIFSRLKLKLSSKNLQKKILTFLRKPLKWRLIFPIEILLRI